MTKPNLNETNLAELVTNLRKFCNHWQSCDLECTDTIIFKKFMTSIHKDIETISLDHFRKNTKFTKPYYFRSDLDYLEIYNDGFLVLMLMFLPEDHYIEYHDHPEMIVFSKLLEGELTLFQCDLLQQESFYGPPKIPGSLFSGTNFSQMLQKKDSIAELFPKKNNLHAIKSHQRSVLLDIVFNYYDDKRPCSHFEAVKDSNGVFSHLRFTKEE